MRSKTGMVLVAAAVLFCHAAAAAYSDETDGYAVPRLARAPVADGVIRSEDFQDRWSPDYVRTVNQGVRRGAGRRGGAGVEAT